MFSKVVMSHLQTSRKINSHWYSCEEIKKGYSFVYHGEFGLKGCQRHKTPDDGGGGGTRDYIHIFIITECIKNNLFPKQINSAEYEYVNI